jgi:hypothetical protein
MEMRLHRHRPSSKLLWLLALTAAIFGFEPAFAQGFMVRPMRMEVAPHAGETIETPLEIRNTEGAGTRTIELRLVELSQSPSGGWQVGKAVGIASSLPWTALSADRVEIPPLEAAEVMVRFSPPANAKGAYVVGVIAETPVSDQATGLSIQMRFLIPVIVEIQGRSVRQQIALDDVVMTYSDGADGEPAGTTAHLRVANKGRTFSRVSGQLTIERKNGERWRVVTRFDVGERSVIPGVTLELGEDLERRLPSGEYRLSGQLLVDGRRVAPMVKEIAFEGDPNATVAYDTALLLEPEMIDMVIVPGAARTAVLKIENPGSDPVNVTMGAKTPRGLLGVQLGNLDGAEFSAEPWTTIQPAEFTIRPGGRQNVRVMSRVPRKGVDHPHYYADLLLTSSYADGQSAGETRSMIHLFQPDVESKSNGVIENISMADGDQPSQYVVDMSFANTGNVHVQPKAQLFLLSAQGGQVRSADLAGEEGLLLPLGKRTFSGIIDFQGVEPGYYALRARVTADGGEEFGKQEIVLIEQEEHAGPEGESTAVTRATFVDPSSAGVPEGFEAESANVPVFPVDDPKDKSDGEAG